MDNAVDLIVIGSGPAGEKGAAQAAYFGKRVALVERAPDLGGACANTGTLPSKALRETALQLSGFRQRELYGLSWTFDRESLSVPQFMVHEERVVSAERARVDKNLERHGIELVRGSARLVARDAVEVALAGGGTRTLRAPVILIATGSSPRRPANVPFGLADVEDSDSILRLDRMPRDLVVVGGGVIGCEYASVFACLGARVTLLEGRRELLGFLDSEITELLTASLRSLGIEILFEDDVERIEARPGGGVVLATRAGRSLSADKALIAAGRVGNVDGLGLEAVGVELDERKRVVVDARYQTSVPGIYAAGDVIGFPSLASTGAEQGRVAMCHAFGFEYKKQVSPLLPYGLYTIPEVGCVGLSEQDCAKQGLAFEVGRAWYRDHPRGQIAGDREGLVKLVFAPDTKRLLGVHVIGERATELVHIGSLAMQLGGTIDAFIDAVFNYPTLSELYKYAAYDGLGRLQGRGEAR